MNYRQSPFANISPVVKNLIIVNVIFYFATWVLGHQNIDLTRLLSVYYFDSQSFRPWQVITYLFMHDPGNLAHLLFNMFALFVFGPMLEMTMGPKRFFYYYFICGIGALVVQWAVQAFEVHQITGGFTIPHGDLHPYLISNEVQKLADIYLGPILGASGAIFGVLVGFGMIFPNVELYLMFIPIPIKAKYVVIGYVAIELFSGIGQFSGDNVAHFAHLGGALFGFILIKLWRMDRPNNFLS